MGDIITVVAIPVHLQLGRAALMLHGCFDTRVNVQERGGDIYLRGVRRQRRRYHSHSFGFCLRTGGLHI